MTISRSTRLMPANDTVTEILRLDAQASEPLVQQIQRLLRAAIDDGKLPIGERLPSMRQIADDAGVSLGIVKQALNTLTAEGYLQSSPRRGVFVGKPPSAVRDVALVLPMLTNEQMVRVANGVRRGLAGTSLRLVIQAADADYDAELHLLELLDPSLVAGTIVYPPGIASDVQPLRKLRERGIPAVQVVHAMDEEETDGVVVDGFNQGRIAMRHLLDLGHRRIGLVDTTADAVTFDDIREGMQAVLADAGMNWEDLERVSLSEADLNPEEPWANGERGARKLLAGHDDLTALLGINPHITLGCYRAVCAADRRVGEDVSVLAVGSDLPTFALLQPSVSVVDSPMEQIGERAAMRLRKLISSDGGRSRITEMPPTLIRRDSVQKAAR